MYTVKNKQTRLHYFSSLQIWSLQGLEFLLLWGLVSHTQASFFICVCVSRRVTFRQTGEDQRAEQYQSVCLCFCHMFFCGECVDVFDANVRYGCLCLCDPAGRTISPPLFTVNSYASVVTPTVGNQKKKKKEDLYFLSSDSTVCRCCSKSLSCDVMCLLLDILGVIEWEKLALSS